MESSSIHIVFLTTVLVGQVTSRAVNISTSWTLPQEGFPHFFRYFKDPATWDDAKIICESFQAELLTVQSDERRDASRAYLKELDVLENVWCGLERDSIESPFVWTGGGPLVGDGFWQDINPVEPEKLCVTINPLYDFRWQSAPCSGPQVYPFICQLAVPSWATGEKGCLLNSLPSLTVTYLPEPEVIELLSDCGLSGTKRIVCKGQESAADLTKRLSCDREDDARSSTQGWTEKTPHGTGHRWGMTTISDWVSGATSRSWGTRHKRESGGTSTSTDTSPIRNEETGGNVEISENVTPLTVTVYPSGVYTADAVLMPDVQYIHGQLDMSYRVRTQTAMPSMGNVASQASDTDTKYATRQHTSSQMAESQFAVTTEHIRIDDTDRAPDDTADVSSESDDIIDKDLKNNPANQGSDNFSIASPLPIGYEISKFSKHENEGKEPWKSDAADSHEKLLDAHIIDQSTTIPKTVREETEDVTSTPNTVVTKAVESTSTGSPITRKEVSYQINPPLILRSGMQAIRKEVVKSEDVIILSGKPELPHTPIEHVTEVIETADITESDQLESTREREELSGNQQSELKQTEDLGNTSKRNEEIQTTEDSIKSQFEYIEQPHMQETIGMIDMLKVSNKDTAPVTMHEWADTQTTIKINEPIIAIEDENNEDSIISKNRTSKTIRPRYDNIFNNDINHMKSNDDEHPVVNTLDKEMSTLRPSDVAVTDFPMNAETNIPIIVIEDLDDPENKETAGEPEEMHTSIIDAKGIEEHDQTLIVYTMSANNLSKSVTITENLEPEESQSKEKEVITASPMTLGELVSVRDSEAVHETSRPIFSEPISEYSDGNHANGFKNNTNDVLKSATVKENDTSTDSSRSTNEPKDTIFDITTLAHSGVQSTTHEVDKAQDFHVEENGDEVSPKRSNRGRYFPHSNPLSFYPYFINRVLG